MTNYSIIIDGMTWSYSRIATFADCPYRFFLKYIYQAEEKPKFYAEYGSFIHSLIEKYYRGKIKDDDMLSEFLTGFSKNVKGARPKDSTVEKYIHNGMEYFKNFKPFPYRMIDVEKYVEFQIDDLPFIGYIDYLGEKNGEYYIVDNKSRNLKPRSRRKKPTVKDKELDTMLKQLYIYATAVKQEYGKFPKALCFNCFRTNTFIEEPFNKVAYDDTIDWAKKEIEYIKRTEEFYPVYDYFPCRYICGVSDDCIYSQIVREERGRYR